MLNRDFVSGSSAVGLGALFGGLLSIEIASRFVLGNFSWTFAGIFGALFGGCVSYIAVDFKQFCEGVCDAYKKTTSWRPNVLYWKTFLVFFTGFSFAVCSTLLAAFGFVFFLDGFSVKEFVDLGKFSIFIGLFFGALITHIPLRRTPRMEDRDHTHELLKQQNYGYWLLTRCNPVCVPFTALFYLGKAIVWIVIATPEITFWVVGVGRSLGSFLIVLIKDVHSQKRAVVFIDGAAGAVIGYLLGSALLGALVGIVILYPCHHHLIAIRVLKVVPR